MTTDHLTVLLWVGGGVAAILGALIAAIWWMFWRTFSDIVKDLRDRLKSCESKLEEERRENQTKRESLASQINSELERSKAKVGDLAETVAGFGGIYLPRREYEVDQDRRDARTGRG